MLTAGYDVATEDQVEVCSSVVVDLVHRRRPSLNKAGMYVSLSTKETWDETLLWVLALLLLLVVVLLSVLMCWRA